MTKTGMIFAQASALALAAGMTCSPALAQEADDSVQVEEIIVTAQKREQSLQDVPVAISAVSSQTLQRAGITSMEDVARLVPSLVAVQNAAPINQSYRVRGIGSDPNVPSFEPSVALFIDGVYSPRSGLGVDDLVDLERIEVLKGPQVTLHGKNATAGVVSVVTSAPSNTFAAHFSASISNIEGGRNALAGRLSGSITGPLAEGVRARITGVYTKQGDTFRNLTPGGGKLNNLERYAVRGQLEFDLGSATTLNLTVGRSETPLSNLTNSEVFLGSLGSTESAILADNADKPGNPFNALAPLFPNAKGCTDFDVTNRAVCAAAPFQFRSQANQVSGTLKSDLGFASLTAITGWSNYKATTSNADVDQVSLPLLTYADTQGGSSISQEIRLVSPNSDHFEWLVGGYYLNTKFNRGDHGRTPTLAALSAAPYFPLPLPPASQTALAPLFGGLAQLSSLGLLTTPGTGTPLGTSQQIASKLTLGQAGDAGFLDSNTKSDYFAIFGQATIHLSEQFSLTGGIRWQSEKKSASINNSLAVSANPYFAGLRTQLIALQSSLAANHPLQAQLPGLIAGTGNLAATNLLAANFTPVVVGGQPYNGPLPDISDDTVTWSGTASYKPNDDTLIYATVSRGYKSSGYTIAFGNAPRASLIYNPESSKHYELGAKLDLLDRRARISLAAFRTDYSDYQNAGFIGLGYLVNNAEKVRISGFEFDGTFALARGLTVNVGAIYVDAKFRKYTVGSCYFGEVPAPGLNVCDKSGDSLPLTPEFRATTAVQYERETGFGGVYGRFDLSWQTKMTSNNANLDPRSVQPAYALANLRVGARFGETIDVSLWANNLFNKNYVRQSAVLSVLSNNSQGLPNSGYQVFQGAPREIGLAARLSF